MKGIFWAGTQKTEESVEEYVVKWKELEIKIGNDENDGQLRSCPRELKGAFLLAGLDYHPAIYDFLTYLEVERNLSPGTIRGYGQDLKVFVRYLAKKQEVHPQDVDLGAVRRTQVRGFLAYLRSERQNATRTINRKLSAVRSLYRFLVASEDWPIKQDPTRGMTSLRRSKLLPVYLTLEEANVLLDSVKKHSAFPERDYAIFMLFLQCGCRFSELLSLTLDNVDLQEGTLRIIGKGRKERLIPLLPPTISALQDYLRVRNPVVPTDRLFLNNKRRPLQANGLRHLFAMAVSRSPLKKKNLTPHKLRHTCLTLLMQAGVDIRTLQEIAGHSNIATTQIYTHVSQQEVKRAIMKHPLGKGKEQ